MPRSLPLLAVLALALAACNRDRPAAPSPAPARPTAPALRLPAPLPPVATPATTASGPARFDGYAGMRFGMTVDEVGKAWGGDLNGKPDRGAICYYLSPASNRAPADLAFMVESDKFVRYDVRNDKQTAPGGGQVGMSLDAIRKLYAGRNAEQPHKYVKGGSYVRIKADDGSDAELVFETDASGKVTQWRVGLPPQVDYLEGCS